MARFVVGARLESGGLNLESACHMTRKLVKKNQQLHFLLNILLSSMCVT